MKHFRDSRDGYYKAEKAAPGWVEITAEEWEAVNPTAELAPMVEVQSLESRVTALEAAVAQLTGK